MAREQEPGGLDMLVLRLLSEREMYGFEIIAELSKRSQEVFQLKEGTLYPLLRRLENEGAVTSRAEKIEGRIRRYYKITKKGSGRLEERKAEWDRYSVAVNAVMTLA